MGSTKRLNYTNEQNHLADLFKALGHPARIAILQSIMESRSCVCGDLVTEIGLAQATISNHLKELKNIGLIKGTVEGTKMCYCIDKKNWDHFQELRESFLNSDQINFNKC